MDPWVVEVLQWGLPYSLCQSSSTVSGTHLHAFLRPHIHQGGCSGGGYSGPHFQGSGRTGSFAFSGLLQPSLYGVEDLGVLASAHRPLSSQSFSGFLSLQDGDHPVCSSLGSSGGLDGVHRPEGSLLADSSSSRVSQVSSVCGVWPSVSIPGSLFRPRLGPPGLHTCYGSCFVNLAFHGYSSSSLFRRLVNPVLVSGGGSSRPSGGPRSLHGARDCGESREVQFCSIPEGTLSGDYSGLPNFGGFSIPGSYRQAAVSRRGISIPRSAAHRLLAVSAGHSVFSHPSCAGGQASYEVSSIPAPPALGSGGGLHSSFLDSRLSPRPPVVVRRASPPARGLSRPGLPGPRLLVRRLGRGLGGSFRSGGCFRPLVSQRGGHFHQRSETSCRGEASSPFPVFFQGLHGGDLRGQLHGGSLSPQFGGYPVSLPQRNSSEDLEVVGASRDHPCSAVHSGQSQCPCGLSLSRPHQSLGSEWTLHRDVFRDLRLRWPVMVDLFATSANHRCSVYFSPLRDPQAAGTDEFLQSWDELQAYAFPPWSIIPRVLVKLRASLGTFLTLVAPYWPQRPWFPKLLDLEVAPSVVLPSRPDLLFQPLSGLRHPDLLRLRLHAWKLSGDSLVRQVSPPV